MTLLTKSCRLLRLHWCWKWWCPNWPREPQLPIHSKPPFQHSSLIYSIQWTIYLQHCPTKKLQIHHDCCVVIIVTCNSRMKCRWYKICKNSCQNRSMESKEVELLRREFSMWIQKQYDYQHDWQCEYKD
jgi:hypothetical protein